MMHKKFKFWAFYPIKTILPVTLICGIIINVILFGNMTINAEESWDDYDINYSSTMMLDPDGSKAEKIMADWEATNKARDEKKAKWKKRLLPFSKKARQKPTPTEEEIINVGPRTHAASSDAIFPLPRVIKTQGTQILPGFYSVKELKIGKGIKTIALLKQNQPIISLDIFLTHTRTGPVEKIKGTENNPPQIQVSTHETRDRQNLVIVYREGDNTYESNPLAIVSDNRQILK